MNADKNEPDGSFPERTKCTKPRRPRPSAAGKRVSPRPAWLTERPAVRVRKDLAAFFEFFTPLHFCVARPHRRRHWTTALVSWQVGTSSVWFYLSNGCRTRNPAAPTAGV